MFVNKHCRDHLDSLIYFVSICKPEAIQACLTSVSHRITEQKSQDTQPRMQRMVGYVMGKKRES